MLNTYLCNKRILKLSILFLVFSDSVGIQVIRLEFLCIVKEKHS